MALIYKIIPRSEWDAAGDTFVGSAVDIRDGFLHFSTAAQLAETLRLYFAGQSDLLLVAIDERAVAEDLKYEYAPSRDADFPHLFAPLSRNDVVWVRDIGVSAAGAFELPALE